VRVIFDECLPRRLALAISGHTVVTVQQAGWASVKNGKLLSLIAAGGYDAFVTVDKSMPTQQTLGSLPFGIIIVRSRSNRIADLRPLAPGILAALTGLGPGQVVYVGQG
jgi:hypothetical protein